MQGSEQMASAFPCGIMGSQRSQKKSEVTLGGNSGSATLQILHLDPVWSYTWLSLIFGLPWGKVY